MTTVKKHMVITELSILREPQDDKSRLLLGKNELATIKLTSCHGEGVYPERPRKPLNRLCNCLILREPQDDNKNKNFRMTIKVLEI